MIEHINIKKFTYDLPSERIAKYPLAQRDESNLLVYKNAEIKHRKFKNIIEELPEKSLLLFNNTKVVKARLVFFKPTGARIEIFCLEPHLPADFEHAFSEKGSTQWVCLVGNLSKWKEGVLTTHFSHEEKELTISARQVERKGKNVIIEFTHSDEELTFGQILEILGRVPIPPYLNRESEESDTIRYQTVYSRFEGSVAAPTAGLHFTKNIIEELPENGFSIGAVTLHVGAGTFLPVKSEDATQHTMHTEHFIFDKTLLKQIIDAPTSIVTVGTTSVRTIESISVLAYRLIKKGTLDIDVAVGQWEAYDIPKDIKGRELVKTLYDYMTKNKLERIKASTQIMITPFYTFKIIDALITNFHQPQSTLLLLISAVVGEAWHDIYKYAMNNDFRFLSYGDSSLLFVDKTLNK